MLPTPTLTLTLLLLLPFFFPRTLSTPLPSLSPSPVPSDILLRAIPPLNGALNDLVAPLTALEEFLALLTGAETTYNDLESGKPCTEFTLIFARGTTEPGNVGIFVGPALIGALIERVGEGGLNVQGVNNYSATVGGARLIEQAHAVCPDTNLVVSGYSQGAQIIHNAVETLPATNAEWISSALLFGDPYRTKTLPNVSPNRVAIYCHVGDNICDNGILILPPHLDYARDVRDAAAFAVGVAGG